jgi:stage II sporulation protein M
MTITDTINSTFRENRLLIAVISAAFFSVMIMAGSVTYLILIASPSLLKTLEAWLRSTAGYIAVPRPYTGGLYRFIFLNNIGHFWNPLRLWVWIPFIGAFDLGYELLLNAVIIGATASFVSLTKGALYSTAGLIPHGVIEIPAFILEFTALARWHATATRAVYAKLSGQPVDRSLFREGVRDTVTLSLLSVMLFAIAAYIETFITPHLLGR